MNIGIKTLTPIWTGGLMTGRMDRIQETGVIGGLRWWYEAIVRGLGGEACDPSLHECVYDQKKYDAVRDEGKPEPQRLRAAGLCDVCRVFGATGYRRRFQLRMANAGQPVWTGLPEVLNVRPPDRSRGWFLPPGHAGDISLTLLGEKNALHQMAALLLFLEKWGTIGAKPQLGYGCFRITEGLDTRRKEDKKTSWPMGDKTDRTPKLPNLKDITFFQYRFKPSGQGWWSRVSGLERLLGKNDTARALTKLVDLNMIPVAPALKNAWRYRTEERIPAREEREVFGIVHNDRIRSKIAVSWAYETDNLWQVRGWVWLPESISKFTIDSVKRRIGDKAIWMDILRPVSGELTLTDGLDALKEV